MRPHDPNIKPDIRTVVIDETKFWGLSDKERFQIKRIEAAYIYDRNEATYLCEATPSYCLTFIEQYPIFADGYEPTESELEEWDNLMREFGGDDPVTYMHCSDVDKLQEIAARKFDEGTSEEAIEEVREYYQGNGLPAGAGK